MNYVTRIACTFVSLVRSFGQPTKLNPKLAIINKGALSCLADSQKYGVANRTVDPAIDLPPYLDLRNLGGSHSSMERTRMERHTIVSHEKRGH